MINRYIILKASQKSYSSAQIFGAVLLNRNLLHPYKMLNKLSPECFSVNNFHTFIVPQKFFIWNINSDLLRWKSPFSMTMSRILLILHRIQLDNIHKKIINQVYNHAYIQFKQYFLWFSPTILSWEEIESLFFPITSKFHPWFRYSIFFIIVLIR